MFFFFFFFFCLKKSWEQRLPVCTPLCDSAREGSFLDHIVSTDILFNYYHNKNIAF